MNGSQSLGGLRPGTGEQGCEVQIKGKSEEAQCLGSRKGGMTQ